MKNTPGVPNGVDHLLYGVPDLERGIDDMEQLLGVRPVLGGRHADYGTRNALVSIGPETYLELIGPDREQPAPETGWLLDLDKLERPRLVAWVLRAEAIDALVARAVAAGIEFGRVLSGSRIKPDGTSVTWKLTDPHVQLMEGAVPFIIAWGDTPHPSASAPDGGTLVSFHVEHPEPERVQGVFEIIGLDMAVHEGPCSRLVATLQTPKGIVELR